VLPGECVSPTSGMLIKISNLIANNRNLCRTPEILTKGGKSLWQGGVESEGGDGSEGNNFWALRCLEFKCEVGRSKSPRPLPGLLVSRTHKCIDDLLRHGSSLETRRTRHLAPSVISSKMGENQSSHYGSTK
jgi:hypothetical protein